MRHSGYHLLKRGSGIKAAILPAPY